MPKPIIFDGISHREMTEKEYSEWRSLCTEIENETIQEQNRRDAELSARAKLAALGLTEAEVKALVG